MPAIIVDTGVCIQMFSPRANADPRMHPNNVQLLDSRLAALNVVMPWPIIYETLRTQFVENRTALQQFERRLRGVEPIDDAPYREAALELAFESGLRRNRPLSLVDCVLRLMLDSSDLRIVGLATYNDADFADVCRRKGIEMLS